jgi:hypothetical protein
VAGQWIQRIFFEKISEERRKWKDAGVPLRMCGFVRLSQESGRRTLFKLEALPFLFVCSCSVLDTTEDEIPYVDYPERRENQGSSLNLNKFVRRQSIQLANDQQEGRR